MKLFAHPVSILSGFHSEMVFISGVVLKWSSTGCMRTYQLYLYSISPLMINIMILDNVLFHLIPISCVLECYSDNIAAQRLRVPSIKDVFKFMH